MSSWPISGCLSHCLITGKVTCKIIGFTLRVDAVSLVEFLCEVVGVGEETHRVGRAKTFFLRRMGSSRVVCAGGGYAARLRGLE